MSFSSLSPVSIAFGKESIEASIPLTSKRRSIFAFGAACDGTVAKARKKAIRGTFELLEHGNNPYKIQLSSQQMIIMWPVNRTDLPVAALHLSVNTAGAYLFNKFSRTGRQWHRRSPGLLG